MWLKLAVYFYYLRWTSDLHDCESDRVELFQTQLFKRQIQSGGLKDILFNDDRDLNTRIKQDDLASVKSRIGIKRLDTIEGESQGTVGLAKSLYLSTELN